MENFTPVASLIGGLLIGTGAAALLGFNGTIAGISGIVAGALGRPSGARMWRRLFIGGLVTAGVIASFAAPKSMEIAIDRSLGVFIAAGLLVGFGTRMGNGCTSGHGICGISRGSMRSLLATITFMATGVATVYLVNHVLAGKQ